MDDKLLRVEDRRFLTGRGRFVDDIHLDRMLQGVFIRSPHAHAEILGIDATAALEAGAYLVLTAKDLPFLDRAFVVRYWHPAIRNGLPKPPPTSSAITRTLYSGRSRIVERFWRTL